MTQYKVIYPFRDLQDKGKTFPNGREYAVNDPFPATKKEVSEERISELSGTRNKIGRKLIERVENKGGEVTKEVEATLEKGEEVVPINSTTIEELTKKEIQEMFDENGIDYKKSDTKAELIARVEGD